MTLARKLFARILYNRASKGNLDLLRVSKGASLLGMQASQIVTTASIGTLEGLLASRWSLVGAVKFFSRELDMTDTDALCSLAAIKGHSN